MYIKIKLQSLENNKQISVFFICIVHAYVFVWKKNILNSNKIFNIKFELCNNVLFWNVWNSLYCSSIKIYNDSSEQSGNRNVQI